MPLRERSKSESGMVRAPISGYATSYRERCRPLLFLTALFAIQFFLRGAVVYTSESDFTNRLSGGYYFNNFETFVAGDQGSTNVLLSGGTPVFSFAVSTEVGPLNNLWIASGTLPSGKALSTSVESTDVLLKFTSSNVTAIAGNFFLSDIAENRATGTVNIILSDGTSSMTSSSSNGPVGFLGFTTAATNPISLLRLHAASQYVTLDNIYVGAVTTNMTPPVLSMQALSATLIELSWPLSAAGFVLRTKPDLSSDGWTDVMEPDVPSNEFHRVRIETSGEMKFFQLQQP